MSIFEMIMLIAFGCAWPPAIYKAWKARTAKGISLRFLIIVLIGYIAGIVHKLLYSMDIVLFVYILNLLMVLCQIFIYFRNRAIDKKHDNN
ncbi:MAG: PQ-loop domain-containing transporter [bacterium]|nr:PQ-loop domain-containing transporter [bacterium]